MLSMEWALCVRMPIKEFESLAASQISTHDFNKQNARSYGILYEISKALTTGHGYEKGGVVHFF